MTTSCIVQSTLSTLIVHIDTCTRPKLYVYSGLFLMLASEYCLLEGTALHQPVCIMCTLASSSKVQISKRNCDCWCRAKWAAVRHHLEGGGEQAQGAPPAGLHPLLLLPHLCPGHGSLLVSTNAIDLPSKLFICPSVLGMAPS